LQIPSQTNGDNLDNVRRETSRTSKKEKMDYFKEEDNELQVSSKNKISETYMEA